MAMAIPSPSSSDDSLPPPTPTTQSDPSAPAPASSAGAIGKRKPSRRANTAERRATHNAVERQRRETLNGRFLDLAALLPNLSQIRRPSKSAIVNSSIAHIHASRRHRLLASRELRTLKHESDALRREINEWRDRAGIPRMEEPVRGDGFSMVLSGELEALVITGSNMEDDDDDLAGQYGMPSYEDDVEYHHAEMEDPRVAMGHSASPPAQMSATPAFTPQMPTQRPSISIAHSSQHVGGPMIASPTAMSFENPAMGMYSEPHVSSSFPATYNYPTATVSHPHMSNLDAEKVAAWNMGMYQQQQMMMQQQQHRVVPQQHGPHPADQAYLASLHHQQRQRSASTASYHSAGGSPPHASAVSVSSGRSSGSASPAQGYDAYDGSNTWMMGGKQATQQVANGGNYGMIM